MRSVVLAIGFVVAALFGGAAAAQGATGPKAVLEEIYAQYASNGPDEVSYFSDSLKGLLAAEQERTPAGEVGALDFSPFINGQDWAGLQFAIGEPVANGDSATANVDILGARPQSVIITLIRQSDGWKVDDIIGQEAGVESWRLSELLTEDALLN